MSNYYQVLELGEQATAEEIRQAYLRLVRLTHPDRTPDPAAHRRYLLINEAYDTLRQPALRARYDASLRGTVPRPAYTVPFRGNAYQVLRVPYTAPPARIEQAYQHWKRLLERAPQGDPAIRRQLADLEHAYATLTTAELRQQHHEQLRRQPPRGPSGEAAVYARYAPVARVLCQVLMVAAALLLLDFVWVRDYPREIVTGVSLRTVQDRRGIIDSYYFVQTHSTNFRADHTYPAGTALHLQRSGLSGHVRSYRPSGAPSAEAHSYAKGWFPRAVALLSAAFGLTAAWAYQRSRPPRQTCDAAATAAIVALLAVYLLFRT
ncbi:J domain-containing protein [Hymenobacter sp. CRA2]|uniref:J domain-containing protein n=1 Tax=Hymenobacter sp. CRA2 TaxID=1955620 RepID=UPI0009D513F7|nr:DnaJ domain-containing protein [Hymenobacter sp. CRA2]OON66758.1 hypothetical protein B0919_21540 [Hymenobacter sp. CRA2]